ALPDVVRLMASAVTDHVFIDGGHTIDFTNKAFEAVDLLGGDGAATVLPTLVRQTALANRSEESGSWRHPHDLAELIDRANEKLLGRGGTGTFTEDQVTALAWQLLGDEPEPVVDAVVDAHARAATPEQLV